MGECCLDLHRYTEAKEAFQRLLALLPTSAVGAQLFKRTGEAELQAKVTSAAVSVETPKPKKVTPIHQPQQKQPRREGRFIGDEIPWIDEAVEKTSRQITDQQVSSELRPQQKGAMEQPKEVESQQTVSVEDYFVEKSKETAPSQAIEVGEEQQSRESEIGLEQLIQRLEGAKIPPVRESPDAFNQPLEHSTEGMQKPKTMVSETLASVYEMQGQFAQAIEAYQMLMETKPRDRAKFEKKIAAVKEKMKQQEL
jgi:tetratricopeptide (TPR) repeat protein